MSRSSKIGVWRKVGEVKTHGHRWNIKSDIGKGWLVKSLKSEGDEVEDDIDDDKEEKDWNKIERNEWKKEKEKQKAVSFQDLEPGTSHISSNDFEKCRCKPQSFAVVPYQYEGL